MLFIGQKLTQVRRIKSVLRIYIFPLNLLSCVQKALENIQTKFHWVRMKHKHFIEVSNICPTITLIPKVHLISVRSGKSFIARKPEVHSKMIYHVRGEMRWSLVSPKTAHNSQTPQNIWARHDKTNNVALRSAKTQVTLGIRPVWLVSSLSAWRNLGSLATHWAHSEDSDQTGWMPRLIWAFAGRTLILLVLSCRGSYTDVYTICI